MKEANSELLPGTQLGGYHIESVIGKGGMGCVYRALQNQLNRACALKVLHPERVNHEHLRRWKREFRALAQLDHPNLLEVYDFGMEREYHYFSMELVDGSDLETWLTRLPQFTVIETLWVARSIAGVLCYIHRQGFVHRDIKPANIMLTHTGAVKVMDFGLSKALNETQLTATGVLLGTPQYMAPELILGYKTTDRLDIYLLGELIFEMLTGESLWPIDDEFRTFHARVEAALPPLDYGPITCPDDIKDLVRSMVARDPEDRPSARSVFNSLKSFGELYGCNPRRLGDGSCDDWSIETDKVQSSETSKSVPPTTTQTNPFFTSIRSRLSKSYAAAVITFALLTACVWLALHTANKETIVILPYESASDYHLLCTARAQSPLRWEIGDAKRVIARGAGTTDCDGLLAIDITRLPRAENCSFKVSSQGVTIHRPITIPAAKVVGKPQISVGLGFVSVRLQLSRPVNVRATARLTVAKDLFTQSISARASKQIELVFDEILPLFRGEPSLELSIFHGQHRISNTKHKLDLDSLCSSKKIPRYYKRKAVFDHILVAHDDRLIVDDDFSRLLSLPWPIDVNSSKATKSPPIIWTPPPADHTGQIGSLIIRRSEFVITSGGRPPYVRMLSPPIHPTPCQLLSSHPLKRSSLFDINCEISTPGCVNENAMYIAPHTKTSTQVWGFSLADQSMACSKLIGGMPTCGTALIQDLLMLATERGERAGELTALDALTLKIRWTTGLPGQLRNRPIESEGWVWFCDGNRIYRISPEREARHGTVPCDALKELALPAPGAFAPPIRHGSRGWILLGKHTTHLHADVSLPVLASFDWNNPTEIQDRAALSYFVPRQHRLTKTTNLLIRDNVLYALFGNHIYAISLTTRKVKSFIYLPEPLRVHLLRPNGQLAVLCRENIYSISLWPRNQ